MAPNKKNGVPDRWTDYTSLGKRIPGTRFIAFKVPLKQSFRRHLSESEVFGPFDLVRLLEKERQQLGLIIDLTFTTRYYRAEDLPDTLYYMKIFTAGHEVPNDATILSFKKAVRHFLHDNASNDKLIGVHCTHGLNRTGYLICRYLIDVDGMMPQKAINLFNESRGHSIERQNYLQDLTTGPKRSNNGMDEPDQEPVQGLANLALNEAPSHQRELNNYNQRSYERHRDTREDFFPFHQRNSMPRFGPPEHQSFRPPLFTHPPPERRSYYPNQSLSGFHCSPSNQYPPPFPSYRFGEPYHHPYLPAPEPTRPPGSHRKHRHRYRKDKTHR